MSKHKQLIRNFEFIDKIADGIPQKLYLSHSSNLVFETIERNDFDLFYDLLKIYPNITDSSGNSALIFSTKLGKEKFVRYIIREIPGSVNDQDIFGNTALMYSIYMGFDSIKSFIISLDPDINKANKYGYTALTYAVFANNFTAVKDLIIAGADIYSRDSLSRNALDHAENCGHDEILNLLKIKIISDEILVREHFSEEEKALISDNYQVFLLFVSQTHKDPKEEEQLIIDAHLEFLSPKYDSTGELLNISHDIVSDGSETSFDIAVVSGDVSIDYDFHP